MGAAIAQWYKLPPGMQFSQSHLWPTKDFYYKKNYFINIIINDNVWSASNSINKKIKINYIFLSTIALWPLIMNAWRSV